MNNQSETPCLTQDENDLLIQFRLFRETQNIALRDQLVCAHLHLVHSTARRFSGLGESLDDMVQEGTIGLLKAVDLFDSARGVKFSTYACHLITSQIQHYLRDRGRLIRQPAWVQELNAKVAKTTEQLAQELGRDPVLAEVAERLNLAESSIQNALAARELNSVTSLTIPSDNAADHDPTHTDKEKQLASKCMALELPVEDRLVLDDAISNLKSLEQQVIQLFFFEDLNQSEIARKLGISVNYSSYLLRRSIAKIKTMLEQQLVQEQLALQAGEETVPELVADIPIYDRLTGLYTSAYLRLRLGEEIARVQRYPTNFALLLLSIRDADGAAVQAYQAIRAIGQSIRQNIRIVDLSTYLGNGRFALMLPHTGREARVLANRLQQRIAELTLAPDDAPRFSLHYGFTVYPIDGVSTDALFKRAETQLTLSQREDRA